MDTRVEEWKQVRDSYGAKIDYAVSNLGRVKSLKTGREGRIMTGGGGWTDQTPARRAVWLMNSFDTNSRKHWVDELVAAAFVGERPEGARLDHINGCIWDDRAQNLKWATEDELPATIFEPIHTPEGHKTLAELRVAAQAAWNAVLVAQEAAIRASKALAYAEGLDEARKAVHGSTEGNGQETGRP